MTSPKTASLSARAGQLSALLAPVLEADGYDLEDVTVSAAGRRSVVRVAVDSDDGVDLDDIAAATQVIGAALDAADEQDPALLGPSYVLEVSSPGVDRPLTRPRHWRRNAGRLIRLEPSAGEPYLARLVEADESTATLDVDGDLRTVAYAELSRATVQIEFRRSEP